MTDGGWSSYQEAARAAQLIELKRPKEALDLLGRAIAQDDASSRLRYLLAVALLQLGRAKEACAAAREAIARDPGSAPAYCTLARAFSTRAAKTPSGLARSQFLRDAYEAACNAVAIAPLSPDSYMVLAETAASRSRFDEAIGAARHAVELAPGSSAAHVTVAYVALAIKDSETAEAAAREALALDPESSAAAVNLAEALKLRGRHQESVAALTDAARLDPVRFGKRLDRHLWHRWKRPLWFLAAAVLVVLVFTQSTDDELGYRLAWIAAVGGIATFRAVQRWQARKSSRAPAPRDDS